MIRLGNVLIQEDLDIILNNLKLTLKQNNINLFKDIKPNGVNIQTTCPFHKGGNENKPSFGINIENGKAHCFTCGWNGNLATLVSEVLYGEYNEKKGIDYLVKHYNSAEIESRKKIEIPTRDRKPKKKQEFLDESVLDQYRYIHPYMYKRGLTDDIIDQFDIGYDKTDECLTFPIRDINGNLVFIAKRSVNSKFFILPSNQEKPVYLADYVKRLNIPEVYITESFLNCLTCWKFGKPAVALMGTGTKEQYKILESLPARSFILAFDPDEAGDHAVTRFRNNVKGKIIKQVIYEEENKDINDLQEDFLNLRISL